jgi:hypothetical protein
MLMARISAEIPKAIQSQPKAHIGVWLPLWIFCFCLQLGMSISAFFNIHMTVSYKGFFDSVPFLLFMSLLTIIIAFQIVRGLLIARADSPFRYIANRAREFLSTPARAIIPAVNYICLITLIFSFGKLKALVGTASPFNWDIAFSTLDRLLHFGADPWHLTHSVFSSDVASWALNMAYNAWFGVLFFFIFSCILLEKNTQLRAQFLLTMSLMWILGGFFIAMIFSSAGPCFYHLILPSQTNPYIDLMQLLNSTHTRLLTDGYPLGLPALATQDMLWTDFTSSSDLLGGGISAFPSMHVAMAVSMALLASRLHRVFGAAMWLFAVTIVIGSVHLGWHYAVDGYMSIILTVAAWKFSGWLINRSNSWYSARHGDEFNLHARA